MNPVLKGHYGYYLDGQRQNIEEPWQLDAESHSVHLSGERIVNGHRTLAVQARYQRRECSYMHLRWQTSPGSEEIGLQYWMRRHVLNWRFEGEHEARRMELPAGAVLFPLIRAASGPLIQLLAKDARPVIVPRLHDPSAKDFLHPLVSQRRAEPSEEPLQWRCFGGEYGDTGALYQLNAQGLTQAYDWASEQGLWQIKLEALDTFQYFPGFKRAP